MFTYRELLEKLSKLTPEQLEMEATVFISDTDDYLPIHDIEEAADRDLVLLVS
jgi:hypothetical protein